MTAVKQRPELLRALQNWKPETRLILLCGPDESGSADLAREVISALGDPSDPMALTDIAPKALSDAPGLLADEAASIPMFGGKKLVRVLQAGDDAAEAVKLLLAAPAAGNPVLLVAGDLKKTGALWKAVDASPLALGFISYPLDARAAGQWLEAQARQLGLQLDREISERLQAMAGGDLGVLGNELEKYALYLNASPDAPQRLERGHLAKLGADSAEEDLNMLLMALLAGERRRVERQMRLLEGSSSIPALRAAARKFMQLREARVALERGKSPADAIAGLRPPVFWKERDAMVAAVKGWTLPELDAALAACFDGERRIKEVAGPGDTYGWQRLVTLGTEGKHA